MKMFCYTFVSSNLLFCASLFLFYFVYACSFVFVEGVMWPQSRNCSGTAYKLSFFCWLGYAESSSCIWVHLWKTPVKHLWNEIAGSLLAPEKLCSPVSWFQPAEGVLSSCKPSPPSSVPTHHPTDTALRTWHCTQRCEGKRPSVCPQWHLSLEFVDSQLLEAQAVGPLPSWALSQWQGHSWGNTVFPLSGLAVDPKHSTKWRFVLFPPRGFPGSFAFATGSSCGVGDIESRPCSFLCLVKQWSGSALPGPLCLARYLKLGEVLSFERCFLQHPHPPGACTWESRCSPVFDS